MQTIRVKHNMEMAHRLFQTPGKCENIHGHSWWVTLGLVGNVDAHGLLEGLDFGIVKKAFRIFLDETFDHRVLLNHEDPLAGPLPLMHGYRGESIEQLPGLQTFPGDPTTELIAQHIGTWAVVTFPMATAVTCDVWETKVNNASWTWMKNA